MQSAAEFRGDEGASEPGAADPLPSKRPLRFGLAKMLVTPVVFALVFGLLRWGQTDTGLALMLGSISATAVMGLVLLSDCPTTLLPAIGGVVSGVVVGVLTLGPCTPAGIFLGPIVGLLTALGLKKLFKLFRTKPLNGMMLDFGVTILAAFAGSVCAILVRWSLVSTREMANAEWFISGIVGFVAFFGIKDYAKQRMKRTPK